MPNTCSAPGCKACYKPSRKKSKNEDINSNDNNQNADLTHCSDSDKVALFVFPLHDSEPDRRARWIARVPCSDWNPSQNANIFLCEKHFCASDIIVSSMDSNTTRRN